jgi:hypothetical protein
MPEGVDEYSDKNNAPDYVEKKSAEWFATSTPPARLIVLASNMTAIPRQPNVSNRSRFI